MALKATTKQILGEADVYELCYFAVDVRAKVVQVIYDIGLTDANGVVRMVRSGVSGRIENVTLLDPLFAKYRSALKADLYKLCQDAGLFPAGTVS